MRIDAFLWDEVNVAKVRGHRLRASDVEGLLLDRPLILRHPRIAGRWWALGYVPDGRFCSVPFERDEATFVVRVVTAHEETRDRLCTLYEDAKRSRPR